MKTALTELIDWIDEENDRVGQKKNNARRNNDYCLGIECLDKIESLMEVKTQVALLLPTEKSQLIQAHHDGYIQAGEDGYRSEHGPRVANPVSSERYYTEKYGEVAR